MGLGEGGEDAAWGYAVLVAELLCLCVCVFFCFLFYFFFCEGVWFLWGGGDRSGVRSGFLLIRALDCFFFF